MRIISGIYKSRKLLTPDSGKIRPTADRAKETLFNILANRFDFHGAVCMDLFCGTGNLGFESISRGASKCIFTDTDTSLVKKNAELLGCSGKCEIHKTDTLQFLNSNRNVCSDIVFADPPYAYDNYNLLLDYVSEMKTLFVLEHAEKFSAEFVKEEYILLKRKIGTVNFTLYDFNNTT